jgi:HD-like signal output (HDOD) protein
MTISKEEVLAKLHQLPSMPAVIQEIMASFNNENLDSSALAEMIARDQGLSAKVLRVANSPFYGLPRTIASIQDAVVVMGFNAVRSLVLSAGFVHAFPPVAGSHFDREAYWKRSFRVAGYAKALAQSLRQEPQMAFTAAMFHDIGQLVLDACIPEQFAQVLQ